MTVTILVGDCREILRAQQPESVNCCVCSPPYWGLRDYKIPPSIWGGDPRCEHEFAEKPVTLDLRRGTGMATLGKRMRGGGHKATPVQTVTIERGFCIHCHAWRGCFGLEPTYQLYVEHMVEIFREVWRALRKDGTLWLNLGDCYACARAGWSAQRYMDEERDDRTFRDKPFNTFSPKKSDGFARSPGGMSPTNNGFRSIDWGYRSRANGAGADDMKRAKGSKHDRRKGSNRAQRGDGNEGVNYGPMMQPNRYPQRGLKEKDLAGIPWRVAFALQDDGWWLRRDIVWHKKNPMPESVFDRPTTAHEYLFLFSKSGSTLCWRHEDGRWTWAKPEPDYRWRHRTTRIVSGKDPGDAKNWFRFNLWRGFDYYYDFAAIMEPSSPDSHARAARSRSNDHKYAGAGPDVSGKPHAIATGSPSAGRYPTPAGWDEGDGHHGSVHRDGRRQEVGVGHNGRATKGVPNGAHRGRGDPAGAGMERWNAPGPNSRVKVDRVPHNRKLAAHDADGPRIKSNESFDAALGTADLVPMRNKRSVWSIATKPFKEAHFATFPPALIEPCILAGCPKGGTVLDPFGGAGTTGLVADLHGRNAILIEINADYAAMAEARIKQARMGPEEKKRHITKTNGKLQPTKGLPLFSARRKAVKRDGAKPGATA